MCHARILLLHALFLLSPLSAVAQTSPPAARVEAVTDTYYGTTIVDPYRWMEEDSIALLDWMRAQDAYTCAVLDRIPGREAFPRR